MLNRKVWRDIKSRKGMFLGVTFIIFLGIALFTSFYISYLNLSDTYNDFYQRTDFEDAGIKFNPAPASLLKDLKKLDGIKEVEGRLSIKSTLEIRGQQATLILISVPDGEQPKVNQLYVEGDYIPKNAYSSAILLKQFADYHNIHAGETISPRIDGEKLQLKITGLAYSPEYIWIIEEGSFFVSPRTLGIAFVPYETLENFGHQGEINEVHFTVYDESRREEILNRARQIFEPYGIKNFYTREEQPSNQALQLDLEGFRELAILIPGFILFISIFAVYVLLVRLINEQTHNIGVLRALGFRKNTILFHYLKHSLFIGVIGSVAGVMVGYILSIVMTMQYTEVINVPYYVARPHIEILLLGLVIGTLAPAISGIFIAKRAADLEIVQSLRGSFETQTKGLEVDKLFSFIKLSTLTRLSLRNTFRNRKRAAYSAFSVVAAIMLIMNSVVFLDAIEETLDLQFNKVMNYDFEVRYSSYVDNTALKEVKSIQGVEEAQPLIMTWMLIERGDDSKSINLIGMGNQNLYNIYDLNGNRIMPPPDGILLPQSTAQNLSLLEGQQFTFVTEKGKKKSEVHRTFSHSLTPNAYASLDHLQEVLSADGYNTIIVKAKPGEHDRVQEQLEDLPGVLEVNSKAVVIEYINDMMEFSYVFIFFSLAFGASLGFAAIFNATSINIMERRKELATLRMLGYTTRQMGSSLFIENMLIGVTGTIVGVPLSYAAAYLFMLAFSSELFQIPFVIYFRTYVLTIIMVFVILSLSILPGLRFISKMNIEKVTKEFVS
ncbi:MAG: ABC transporter permease [Archaeoglobaceae archaeon]